MKIRVEHIADAENEVILRCKELDEEMLEILSLLRERTTKLIGQKNGEIHMLQPSDLLYVDSVDGKTFLYTRNMVLETAKSLSRLEELHSDTGIVRIGKSQLVNLYHVAKLKSLPNSRIEITLISNEKLIVSRHYVQDLKERLEIKN